MSVPQSADRLLAEGRQLHALGRLGEAEAAYRAVLTAAPDDHRALACLGILRHQQGEAAAAVELLGRAAAIEPGDVTAWQHLPLPLVALGRHEEAIAAGAVAVRLAPERADVRINHALALISGQRWAEAVPTCETAIALDPQVATAWSQLGYVRHRLGDHAVAVALFDRAIALDPALVEAHVNKGAALQALGRDEEAERAYEAALARDPAHRAARINRGVVQRNLGRIDAAIAGWRAAPERFPELDYNLACALLLKGDWAAGWPGYEHRFETTRPFSRLPATDRPRWNGTPMPDGTLLVHVEQGLGDTIQFVRCLEHAAARVGHVVLVCQPVLRCLLSSLPIAATPKPALSLAVDTDPLPPHDVWTPLLSLPGLFGLDRTTMPRRAPYLFAEPERVAAIGPLIAKAGVPASARVHVGLAWQGNPNAPVEKGRSIPLAAFAPLGRVDGVGFLALQRGPGVEQEAPEGLILARPPASFDAGFDAFRDTAAALAVLDLLITSDSAIVHVAAALGRPVWMIVKKVPDWRWEMSGTVSPWYPTLRVFRQSEAGDWASAMRAVAVALGDLVAELGPDIAPAEDPSATFEAAVAAHTAGRHEDAAALYRRVIAADRRHARAWNFLGMALFEGGGRSEAVTRRALTLCLHGAALAARDPDLYANAAVVLRAAGQGEDAAECLRHALALDPDHRAANLNLVHLDQAAGRLEAGLARATAMLDRQPDDEDVIAAYAGVAQAAGRTTGLIDMLDSAVTRAQRPARLWILLGKARLEAGDTAGGRLAFETALLHDPANADALNNLGVDERSHGEIGLALWFYRSALKVAPRHAEAWCNFGIACVDAGLDGQAEEAFRSAITLRPDYADARMALGTVLLARGDLAAGWAGYEWRLRSTRLGFETGTRAAPDWQGEDLDGRTLLIVAEQGFGDAIQFIRYAALVKAAGAARVIIGCRAKLRALLATAPGVDAIVVEGETLPPCDYQIAMMSLPHRFGSRLDTLPATMPYLRADPERVTRWAKRLAPSAGFRIGIVWQGNPDPRVDKGRSLPLADFEPLARVPGVRLIALQKGPGAEQVEMVADRFTVETLGEAFDGGPDAFADTAAVMMSLDLIVTSDTAVAHLAGALARPVFILLKPKPEWRFLRDRSDSPWYPTARLFHRRPDRPWSDCVADVAAEVARLAAGDRKPLFDRPKPAPAAPSPALATRFEAAQAHHVAGRLAEARAAYAAILTEAPNHAETLHMLGAIALQQGSAARALLLLRGARSAGLEAPELLTNIAVALRMLGRLEEAEAMVRAVLAKTPRGEAWLTLGNVLRDRDRLDEAIAAMDAAVAAMPGSAKALRGQGLALKQVGRLKEALVALDAALAIDPDDADARLDRAHVRLAMGDLRGGFADYEARWLAAEMRPRTFPTPAWDGKPRLKERLLVHGEQGLGDQLQFARFLPLAAERAGELIVEVRRPLFGMLRTVDVGTNRVRFVEAGKPLPEHDRHVALMSLPHVLRLGPRDLPGPMPYLHADPERVALWRRRLRIGGDGRLCAGLIWQGNPKARADRGRSPPLSALEPLLAMDRVRFIALQKEHGLDQLADVALARRIERPGHEFDEGPDAFLDTAALMMALDVVICSDTAAAHLAGALARPTILMLPAVPDWRWMLDRPDCLWYPTMRLVRQPRPGDWEAVARAVRALVDERAQAA
ncbi:MAG: tetratricopeptide repeat protein [Labrys sp. (in: a-proteobacteria)]